MTLALLLSASVAVAVWLVALAAFTPRITGLQQRRDRGLRRLEEGGTVTPPAQAAPVLRRTTRVSRLARLMRPRGQEPSPADLLPALSRPMVVGLGLAALALGVLLSLVLELPLVLCLPLGAVAVFLITLFVLKLRAGRRRAQVAERMPEALEMIVRALRVGQPISAALKLTGDKLPGALGDELRLTSEKISFGQDTASALYAMAERTGNTDLRFLAATVSIQIVSGGNLAEVLDRLAGIARSRQQLRRKIDAITAEAKWSGRFLSGFPILAIAGVWVVDNNYFDSLVESAAFTPVCIVVVTLLVLNVLFMRWLGKLD